MTQTQRLLEYLKTHQTINPMEAWRELGIYRLASRICELKKDGHCIIAGRVDVDNQFGEKCTVAQYNLATFGSN